MAVENRSGTATSNGGDAESGVPSNAELSERTARVEEKIDSQGDTLDRIEKALVEDHNELAEQVEENDHRATVLWNRYQVAKWIVGAGGALGSFLGGLVAAGVV